jgi:hypothetical protein
MNRDPIPFIEELGYTPREATFLYAVGMHSGYFLRRQFDAYIGRVKGAISQHFLNKAERCGHIRALDYGENRKVFHLYWKPIYRLLGDEDSQHRRVKGDLQVKIRLMILDYVLRDTQEHLLETEQSKVEFFTRSCGLSADLLPVAGSKSRYFPDHFPISTLPHGKDKHPTVRFAFMDEGLFSLRKFERFVLQHERLFRALRRFRVIYVSDAQRNFAAARKYLAQRFPRFPDALREEDFPLGIDHFLEYLEAMDVFDNTRLVLTREETDVLEQGERMYTAPIHSQLEDDWYEDRVTLDQISARYAHSQNNTPFETVLFRFKYPVLEHRRSRPSGNESVLLRTPLLPLIADE